MVSLVRQGYAQRVVARRLGTSLSVVQHWLVRAGQQRLDRVDWWDHAAGPKQAPNRTSPAQEATVARLRRQLGCSPLGECGAAAIRAAWPVGRAAVPSLRTIGRILGRCGLLDGNVRARHPAPPRGWYLPAVAAGQAELDSFDCVEGLVLAGYGPVEVFNGISLHGGLVDSWPHEGITTDHVLAALTQRWQRDGLPGYAQFDNDTRFQGAHQWADAVGRVSRFCLQLGVTPVFTPPQETGFQAAIENYNGRWQVKVWARWRHAHLSALRARSWAYVAAHRQRAAGRTEQAPPRRRWPRNWQFDSRQHPRGVIIFLRRTSETGQVHLLGHSFRVAPDWPHRLVRAEVDFSRQEIRFYPLRRRAPEQQPLLSKVPYVWPPAHEKH